MKNKNNIINPGQGRNIAFEQSEKTHILSHELYNIGHMYEAAVAHYQATGKRTFLDIARHIKRLLNRQLLSVML